MLAILAWLSIQRHLDCQKRNGVSGPVANRIEREALILEARASALTVACTSLRSRLLAARSTCTAAATRWARGSRSLTRAASSATRQQAKWSVSLLIGIAVR